MEFKIYVANLAKYVEGKLVGDWITLPMDEDDLQDALGTILGDDEELAIHDYENDFNYRVGEYESIWDLNDMAIELDDLDEHELMLVEAYLDLYDNNLRDALDHANGDWFTIEADDDDDLGRAMVDEGLFGVDIPDALASYIDYEAIGRDERINSGGTYMKGWYVAMNW